MLSTLLMAMLVAGPRQYLVSDEVLHLPLDRAEAAPSQAAEPPKPVFSLPISRVDSPNQDDRPAGMAIDTLVIHDTETPGIQKARTIANYFLNPHSEVSAHYIIGKAGEIVQCVPDEKRAWHAGPSLFEGRERVNDFSIGIELVNAQTGTDPFTDAQYTSLIALSADLVTRYNIPLTHITGHHNITKFPLEKRDPASNFDWERYLVGVQAMAASHVVQRVVTPLDSVGAVGGSGR